MTQLLAILLIAAAGRAGSPTRTICIDPGHPSEVGRGTSGRKVSEIHVAWEVAKRLEAKLIAKGFRVVLTKSAENEFVKNRDRAGIANRCHADLMVRLHCDASNGTGFTTYYPDRQGVLDRTVGPEPTLLKRIEPIAKRFHDVLRADLSGFLRDNGILPDNRTAVGSLHGALVGSIYSKVPVVLVEMCVLTNPRDEELVCGEPGKNRLAAALADACIKCLAKGRQDPNP